MFDIAKILSQIDVHINKYGPTVNTVLELLGPNEKAWMNYNAAKMSPFLRTSSGISALQVFLGEFQKYVEAESAKDSD